MVSCWQPGRTRKQTPPPVARKPATGVGASPFAAARNQSLAPVAAPSPPPAPYFRANQLPNRPKGPGSRTGPTSAPRGGAGTRGQLLVTGPDEKADPATSRKKTSNWRRRQPLRRRPEPVTGAGGSPISTAGPLLPGEPASEQAEGARLANGSDQRSARRSRHSWSVAGNRAGQESRPGDQSQENQQLAPAPAPSPPPGTSHWRRWQPHLHRRPPTSGRTSFRTGRRGQARERVRLTLRAEEPALVVSCW